MERISSFEQFLNESKDQLLELIQKHVNDGPIKYNLVLEATYNIPETDCFEDRTFKTSARAIFAETSLSEVLEEDFKNVLNEQEHYHELRGGYTLSKIDGIVININKYRPIGG